MRKCSALSDPIAIKIKTHHEALRFRLEEVKKFREQHEQLLSVIKRVLKTFQAEQDTAATEQVQNAYESVAFGKGRPSDVLDLSEEGTSWWASSMSHYNSKVNGVETKIISYLRDQLGKARNANEMFRIFSKINALFVRPRIREAIQEYQSKLIQKVKEDIRSLQKKCAAEEGRDSYNSSLAAKMGSIRDLPPLSGRIIWFRNIERHLKAYMQRVSNVLGEGWEDHPDGKKLKEESDNFRAVINTQKLYDEWETTAAHCKFDRNDKLFTVRSKRVAGNNEWQLVVNFDREVITLFKETRNLQWLGFRVPINIQYFASDGQALYPYSVSLQEAVTTYTQALKKMGPRIRLIVSEPHKSVQNAIAEGVGYHWNHHKLEAYVNNFLQIVLSFQEKVDEALETDSQLQGLLEQLATCNYEGFRLRNFMGSLQERIDELCLHGFSNLHQWVEFVNTEVEAKLKLRLEQMLSQCSASLGEPNKATADQADLHWFRPFICELRMTNQVMHLLPSLAKAREDIFFQLSSLVNVVCELPRLQSTRYHISAVNASNIKNFNYLLAGAAGTELPNFFLYEDIKYLSL
ncbi:cytoplasmic dynein 1 heavy chain 1-like [Zophobas morio]|uniref:cytoplasmic dynein 1 heavy chain 1-like n=1 Tax=Zophobas morio TaxID=2755281 RepID=UPI00308383BC